MMTKDWNNFRMSSHVMQCVCVWPEPFCSKLHNPCLSLSAAAMANQLQETMYLTCDSVACGPSRRSWVWVTNLAEGSTCIYCGRAWSATAISAPAVPWRVEDDLSYQIQRMQDAIWHLQWRVDLLLMRGLGQ